MTIGPPTPVQRFVEIRDVSEYIHVKVWWAGGERACAYHACGGLARHCVLGAERCNCTSNKPVYASRPTRLQMLALLLHAQGRAAEAAVQYQRHLQIFGVIPFPVPECVVQGGVPCSSACDSMPGMLSSGEVVLVGAVQLPLCALALHAVGATDADPVWSSVHP